MNDSEKTGEMCAEKIHVSAHGHLGVHVTLTTCVPRVQDGKKRK